FLVVAELTGTAAQGRIGLAAPLTLAEIEHGFASRIESKEEISFDAASANLRGRRTRRFGAIALVEQMIPVAASGQAAQILADGIVALGLHRLPWSKTLLQWRGRVMFLRRAEGGDWPDLSDAALAAPAADWLVLLCQNKTSLGQIAADDLSTALHALIPWSLRKRLEAEAPTHFSA